MRLQGWGQIVLALASSSPPPETGRQILVNLLNVCESCLALAGPHHTGLLARQRGQKGAPTLSPDHVLPHLESHEEGFCSGVVGREGRLLGRCCEREVAVAGGIAPTSG